ncbi:MAG: ribosome biogenesis/translation initiation ATPase RLI [Methanomassiliicoccales archaeon]|nr:MAG: ribosome biogenesis/translation initiation ATPase RLI [Methanomassiliicoccales archaeon]
MRIAVLIRDRCQSKKCSLECIRYCPPVRTGTEAVVMGDDGKVIISEELCVGCGICIHKCPFDAIRIIGLPEELEGDLVHQYGENGFRLYRLPRPRSGMVVGLLGPNGIGKTTVLSILSGEIIPNLGVYDEEPSWEAVLDHFSGTEIYEYMEKVSSGEWKPSVKPQYVDKLSKVYKGKVSSLLKKVDHQNNLSEVKQQLELSSFIDKDISKLSGGELQRVAIAATILKEADVYFFDEPSSYLDIYQRLQVAKSVQKLAEEKPTVVVEHDLAVFDFLATNVHLMYGSEGAYGVLSHPRPVRTAINVYLRGFLREENVRFRETEIRFESHPPRKEWSKATLLQFEPLKKRFKSFILNTGEGSVGVGEVVGVVGPNATGKTTFVKMLAGEIKPTAGTVGAEVTVSYKPQYLESKFKGTVRELYMTEIMEEFESNYFQSEILKSLGVSPHLDRELLGLSGGELQRVAMALCLGRKADLYLIDEPSAYLDSNQRMQTAKTIRRSMEKRGLSGLIVDHDVYFLDLVSDSLMVFGGEPGVKGFGEGPFEMREGMNRFLKMVEITFRRDNDTNRPRINKSGSALDREQKAKGEYYYSA